MSGFSCQRALTQRMQGKQCTELVTSTLYSLHLGISTANKAVWICPGFTFHNSLRCQKPGCCFKRDAPSMSVIHRPLAFHDGTMSI
jgi:hypothetical protein